MVPETQARKCMVLRRLQRDLRRNPRRLQHLVVPSFGGIPPALLRQIKSVDHYVERTLSHSLWHLRDPEAELIFVTRRPVDREVLDQQLAHLPAGARDRLHVVITSHGNLSRPLTAQLLADRRALERVRQLLDPGRALLVPFLVSEDEQRLACELGIPVEGPIDLGLNTKSGSHSVFREAGVPHQRARINLRSVQELQTAMRRWYDTGRSDAVAIKLDAGVSGLGIIRITRDQLRARLARLGPIPDDTRRRNKQLSRAVRRTVIEVGGRNWPAVRSELAHGFVVEEWFDGEVERSPSVQGFISPTGDLSITATHDQLLDGEVFQGASFPAFPHDPRLRRRLMHYGERIARVLSRRGAIGTFAVDFIFGRTPAGRRVMRAIEINLRQGGTTHPYRNALALKGARFDRDTGLLLDSEGEPLFYVATDNGHSEAMKGYSTGEVLGLLSGFDLNTHMVVPEQGKIGFQVFGSSAEEAQQAFEQVTCYLASLPERTAVTEARP